MAIPKRLFVLSLSFVAGALAFADALAQVALDRLGPSLAVHAAAGLALVVAAGVAYVVTTRVAAPLTARIAALAARAERMAAGGPPLAGADQATTGDATAIRSSVRPPSDKSESRPGAAVFTELEPLGRGLDRLAVHLRSTLVKLETERGLHGRILEGMTEGVLVVDAQDRLVMMNPSSRAMLGLAEDAEGGSLQNLEDVALAEILRSIGEEPPRGPVEIEVRGKRLLVQGSLLGSDAGRLAVLVDVTDLRRLESLRRDFVANVSHELRTPVAAVLSAGETLRSVVPVTATAATRFLDIIDRNAKRLRALIEDLLELSRLESKEFRLKKEPVDLRAAIDFVFGLFRERAEAKGVGLVCEVADGVTPVGDVRAVEQILTNLVDNAVKYCPSGAVVTVRAQNAKGAEGETVQVTVEDSGAGIDEKHLPRLFERFYRVDAGRSRELGGTGLGLSIVKHLSEALGGGVEVASEMGRGSIFTVTLPANAAP